MEEPGCAELRPKEAALSWHRHAIADATARGSRTHLRSVCDRDWMPCRRIEVCGRTSALPGRFLVDAARVELGDGVQHLPRGRRGKEIQAAGVADARHQGGMGSAARSG